MMSIWSARVPVLGVLLFLAACAAGGPRHVASNAVTETYPFERPAYCRSVIAGELQNIGVNPDEIASIKYTVLYRNSSLTDNRVEGYEAWVRLKDRSGALVIIVDEGSCFTQQVYTRAGLAIDGVRSF